MRLPYSRPYYILSYANETTKMSIQAFSRIQSIFLFQLLACKQCPICLNKRQHPQMCFVKTSGVTNLCFTFEKNRVLERRNQNSFSPLQHCIFLEHLEFSCDFIPKTRGCFHWTTFMLIENRLTRPLHRFSCHAEGGQLRKSLGNVCGFYILTEVKLSKHITSGLLISF